MREHERIEWKVEAVATAPTEWADMWLEAGDPVAVSGSVPVRQWPEAATGVRRVAEAMNANPGLGDPEIRFRLVQVITHQWSRLEVVG